MSSRLILVTFLDLNNKPAKLQSRTPTRIIWRALLQIAPDLGYAYFLLGSYCATSALWPLSPGNFDRHSATAEASQALQKGKRNVAAPTQLQQG